MPGFHTIKIVKNSNSSIGNQLEAIKECVRKECRT